MKLNLYEHNKAAYEKAIRLMDEYGKAAVIHPTGTGKSFIAFKFVEDNPGKKFVWLAPSEYIFRMQMKNLYETQGIIYKNIEFHTYQWLLFNEEGAKELKPDYIILDEFHRTGALEWGSAVNKLIEGNPKAKVLGLSATNIRYLDNQRDMAEELFEGNIASEISLTESMARGILPVPKYVVSVFYYHGVLSSYEEKAKALRNKHRRKVTEELIEKLRRALEQADGVDKVFEKHITERSGKYIIFCASVEHMYEMISHVTEWFHGIDPRPHVYHMHSYNLDSEKDFQSFVEDNSMHLKLLFAVDMLNEGIHVGDIDGIVLFRPTVSPIVYKQQIGRVLSAGATGRPIIFDMVNNFDSLYSIDALKKEFDDSVMFYSNERTGIRPEVDEFEIIDELKDTRELFEVIQRNLGSSWDEYLRELDRYKKTHGDIKISKRYITDTGLYLGKWLNRQRSLYNNGQLPENKIKILEDMGMNWERVSDQSFDKWINLLREYKDRYGHCRVPIKYKTAGGDALGEWSYRVRKLYKAGNLSEDRIERLNELKFCWEDQYGIMWKDGYNHAKRYYKKYGNINVPKNYVCRDGYKLGSWIRTQRRVKRGATSGKLDANRIKKLEALGMIWNFGNDSEHFREMIKAYKKYAKNHKGAYDCIAEANAIYPGLYEWIAKNRLSYKKGTLCIEKYEALNEAGFVWDNYEKYWNEMFEAAEAFFKENGSLNNPNRHNYGEKVRINAWIRAQRTEYLKPNHGKLDADKIDKLNSIGIRWEKSVPWMYSYEEYRKYVKEHGTTEIPASYINDEGYNLGRWVSKVKGEYRKGALSKEKIQKLDKLGVIWEDQNTYNARLYWEKMFAAATKYFSDHGDLKIPSNYETENGEKLGQWVSQLRRIKKGTLKHSVALDEKKIAALDAIGFIWEPAGRWGSI